MRILSFLLVFAILSFGLSTQSHASAKPWSWGWWPGHWQGLDFQPYLGDQGLSQRSIWDDDTWTPEAWIKDAGDAKRIMRDFYAADIVKDQYKDSNDIPVLEIGDKFIQLSGLDQRRILRFVDHVFEITTAEDNGMFYVVYKNQEANLIEELINGDDIYGVYNKHGLQTY